MSETSAAGARPDGAEAPRWVRSLDSIVGPKEGTTAAPVDCIVLGDSREALRVVASGSVDLIHTSPPYNIEKPYAHVDDALGDEEYLGLLRDVFSECFRTLRPHGSLFFQVGYSETSGAGREIVPIDTLTYPLFREIGFRLWDRVVWHYFGGMSFTRKFKNTHEVILWWVKPGPKGELAPYFDVDGVRERSRSYDKRNNLLGKNPGNVWLADRVAYGGHARQTSHIAVYPEAITERIVRACSRPGDMVVDPFAGSGTTPAVARSLGRRWLGIEISPTYATEAGHRVGAKQGSEVETLGSGLLKAVAFGNTPGKRPFDFLVDSYTAWLKRCDLGRYAEMLGNELTGVFVGDLFGSRMNKSAKPGAWRFFDEFFRSGAPEHDPLVTASSVLDASYAQRRRWNGLRRFRDTVVQLGELVNLTDNKPTDLVGRLVDQEPTSFTAEGNYVIFNGPPLILRKSSSHDEGEENPEQAVLDL